MDFTKIIGLLSKNDTLKNLSFNLLVEEELNNDAISSFRKDICKGCKFNYKDVCRKCNCFIDVKVLSKTNYNVFKKRIEVTHCPEGFWNDKEIANLY